MSCVNYNVSFNFSKIEDLYIINEILPPQTRRDIFVGIRGQR